MASDLRTARLLSWLIVPLLAIVSAGGSFFAEELYRDNALVTQAYHGQDLVTLFVAVPLLIVGLIAEKNGSVLGRMTWIAMLGYALYGNLFYLLGAGFNVFFLLYVALFGFSLWALVLSVPRLDVGAMASGFGGRAARGVSVGYMLLTAAGLGTLWTAMSLGFVFSGEVPAPIVQTGHPTGVVFALDLSLIVPLMVVGAVHLIRGRAWGWVLAAVLSIKGAVYTLGLSVATVIVSRQGLASGAELPVWITLTALGALSAGLLVADLRGGRTGARAFTEGRRRAQRASA